MALFRDYSKPSVELVVGDLRILRRRRLIELIDKHKEFAEAMRNIMRNNEAEQKKTEPKRVDEELDEETRSLQELLEAKFDELFGPIEDDDED